LKKKTGRKNKKRQGIFDEISKSIINLRIRHHKQKKKQIKKQRSKKSTQTTQKTKTSKNKNISQEKKKNLLDRPFSTQHHKDLIDNLLERKTQNTVMRMNKKQRIEKHNDLNEYQKILHDRMKITKDKNEKRRLSKEIYKTERIIHSLEYVNSKYGAFDNNPRPHPGVKKINTEMRTALFELQKDEREWGGGINLRMSGDKFPAKIIARQGTHKESYQDPLHDAMFHTHPDRKLNPLIYDPQLKEVEKNLAVLEAKVHSEKSKERIELIGKKYRSPIDTLPSATDIKNMDLQHNGTSLIVSNQGIMSLTNLHNANGNIPKPKKDYYEDIIKLAAVKSDLVEDFKSVKDAERKIEKYQDEVIRSSKSFYNSIGLESDFVKKEEDKNPEIVLPPFGDRKVKRDYTREKDFWTGNIKVKVDMTDKTKKKK
jgi:hypothetical protein